MVLLHMLSGPLPTFTPVGLIATCYQAIFWVAVVLFILMQGMLFSSTFNLIQRSDVVLRTYALRNTGTLSPVAQQSNTHIYAQPASIYHWYTLLRDYISLTKPRVLSLLLLTTLVAMILADDGIPSFRLVFWTMLGGYLAAGGAGALNCALDCDIDRRMGRTGQRPVPGGRIAQHHAFWFGVGLSILAFVVLATYTTMLAAFLAITGVLYYTLLYTRWLKRSGWYNVVIGGGAGALPPLVGWAAVNGTLPLPAFLLAMIIFYWTPVHFWTLALVKQEEYAHACVPMLPVVAGEQETRWQIMLYAIVTVALSLLLTPLGIMGPFYLLLAVLLNSIFIAYAWNVWRDGDTKAVWSLYAYCLVYLALLFLAMVIDTLL